MRFIIPITAVLLCTNLAFGQKELITDKGQVTYVSSLNVYVKFTSTELIQKGDTLFKQNGETWQAALVVSDKSSTSCVCKSLLPEKSKVGDAFFSRKMVEKKPEKPEEKDKKKSKPGITRDSLMKPPPLVRTPASDNHGLAGASGKQRIRGRISAASYSNIYGNDITHRMRYTFSFTGNNLNNSRFSTESYISFRHTLGDWKAVQDNLADALKVYSLAVKYQIDSLSSVSLGRKINNHIASMGAIDGAQVEKSAGHFLLGAIAGWRPDYLDYSFNPHLFQAGAFVSHTTGKNFKTEETTLAFVEQRNQGKVDRRFMYFQHNNNLSKNLNFFLSFETDLYQLVDSVVTHDISLTNFLLALRYRASKNLSLNFSYDNRKNIIYYESYKSYIDQLIENETRQGLRLGANYRFPKLMSVGGNYSWRFQKGNTNLSKNLNGYINFNQLPWVKATISLSANWLQTTYLDSKLYGIRLIKDLVPNKLQSEFNYEMVEYNYTNLENKLLQQVGGISLSWYITRKLGFYVDYEGTFSKNNKTFHRFNTRLIQRF